MDDHNLALISRHNPTTGGFPRMQANVHMTDAYNVVAFPGRELALNPDGGFLYSYIGAAYRSGLLRGMQTNRGTLNLLFTAAGGLPSSRLYTPVEVPTPPNAEFQGREMYDLEIPNDEQVEVTAGDEAKVQMAASRGLAQAEAVLRGLALLDGNGVFVVPAFCQIFLYMRGGGIVFWSYTFPARTRYEAANLSTSWALIVARLWPFLIGNSYNQNDAEGTSIEGSGNFNGAAVNTFRYNGVVLKIELSGLVPNDDVGIFATTMEGTVLRNIFSDTMPPAATSWVIVGQNPDAYYDGLRRQRLEAEARREIVDEAQREPTAAEQAIAEAAADMDIAEAPRIFSRMTIWDTQEYIEELAQARWNLTAGQVWSCNGALPNSAARPLTQIVPAEMWSLVAANSPELLEVARALTRDASPQAFFAALRNFLNMVPFRLADATAREAEQRELEQRVEDAALIDQAPIDGDDDFTVVHLQLEIHSARMMRVSMAHIIPSPRERAGAVPLAMYVWREQRRYRLFRSFAVYREFLRRSSTQTDLYGEGRGETTNQDILLWPLYETLATTSPSGGIIANYEYVRAANQILLRLYGSPDELDQVYVDRIMAYIADDQLCQLLYDWRAVWVRIIEEEGALATNYIRQTNALLLEILSHLPIGADIVP